MSHGAFQLYEKALGREPSKRGKRRTSKHFAKVTNYKVRKYEIICFSVLGTVCSMVHSKKLFGHIMFVYTQTNDEARLSSKFNLYEYNGE